MTSHNFMEERLIRVEAGSGTARQLTLPGVFAALIRDEIESFPALRPHQRHAWHAFLVQVGALALIRAGRAEPPEDEAGWAALLWGLTPDHPDDAPWSLVAPPDRPALLQPPLPGAGLAELKNTLATPDELDMLVTAKNHDVKQAVMAEAAPDDWLFALVTLQTMEGFLGAGNYGISRMNGGFANRAGLGVAPAGSAGAHVRRDLRRLLDLRPELAASGIYPATGGLGLVWLKPWDGATSLRPSELDPYYVEICRRVRLIEVGGGRLAARTGGSKAARVVTTPGGLTGDPWAPVVLDKEGAAKSLTVDAGGFGYRRMVRLMFGQDGITISRLQEVARTDDDSGLALVARALVRGQGKTEGYHERRVPLSKAVAKGFRARATEPIAEAAQKRLEIAGEIQGRVLKPALLALFENGPEQIDFRDDGAGRRAEGFLARFERAVDRDFFERLWEEFGESVDSAAARAVRAAWVADLLDAAWALVEEADRGMSKAVRRRYRAWTRAEAVFHAAKRKSKVLGGYLPERPHHDAA